MIISNRVSIQLDNKSNNYNMIRIAGIKQIDECNKNKLRIYNASKISVP